MELRTKLSIVGLIGRLGSSGIREANDDTSASVIRGMYSGYSTKCAEDRGDGIQGRSLL